MTTLPKWIQDAINLDNHVLVKSLETAYAHSWIMAKEYHEDPHSFIKAFRYINTHPAFWWRESDDADSVWLTSNYQDRIWCETVGGSHDYQWALEAGRNIAPSYTSHYHDLRLDVYGVPVEFAYLKLAAIVDQVFDDDGVERDNIEHLDSPLMKEVEKRYDDWKEQQEKDDKN